MSQQQQQELFNKTPIDSNNNNMKMEEEKSVTAENNEMQDIFGKMNDDSRYFIKNPALLQLIKSYSVFMNESSDVMLDMDVVLAKLLDATRKLKPPTNSTARTMNVWNYLLDLDKNSIDAYSASLRALPDTTVYECLQNIEKLYLKLMIEFNTELKRGRKLGLISNETMRTS